MLASVKNQNVCDYTLQEQTFHYPKFFMALICFQGQGQQFQKELNESCIFSESSDMNYDWVQALCDCYIHGPDWDFGMHLMHFLP